jgi:hypothetical protein
MTHETQSLYPDNLLSGNFGLVFIVFMTLYEYSLNANFLNTDSPIFFPRIE